MSKNQVIELVWRTAKPPDRPKDGCLLTWKAGVNQCQPVVALDQEGVCEPIGTTCTPLITRFTAISGAPKQFYAGMSPNKIPEFFYETNRAR